MRIGLPSRKRTGKTGIIEFRAKSSLRFIQVEIKNTMWASSLFTPTGSCQNRRHPDLVLSHPVTKGAGTRKTSYHSVSAPSLALQAPSFLLVIASESEIQIAFLNSGLRPAPDRPDPDLSSSSSSSSILRLSFSFPPSHSLDTSSLPSLVCAILSHSPVILLLLLIVRPPSQCSCFADPAPADSHPQS